MRIICITAAPNICSTRISDKVAHDQTPYSDAVLENAPTGRVLKQGAPGTAWKASPVGTDDHAVEYVYLTNGYHAVLRFDYNPATGILLNNLSYYEESRLVVKKTIDEHNFETIEYSDKQSGRVVCKRCSMVRIPMPTSSLPRPTIYTMTSVTWLLCYLRKPLWKLKPYFQIEPALLRTPGIDTLNT